MSERISMKWTRFSEQKPNEATWYLVWGPGWRCGSEGEWSMGEWWDSREELITGVTHWMPFPEGPNEA